MKSPELSEFFSLLGKAKKEKEEEFDNLLKEANINLDVLVKTVSSGIKKAEVEVKEQKKKEKKLIEQLDNVLVDVAKPPEVVVGVPEDFDIESLEEEEEKQDDYEELKKEIGSKKKPKKPAVEEIKEEDSITKAIKFIEDTTVKEEVENSDVDVQSEIRKLKNILNRVLAQGPGSGEVNLLKLDDVDEDSAKVDGKVLQYQASSGKFIGGTASGIGTQDSLNTSGIITAAQFSGYSHLIAPFDSTTKTITVKVASKISGQHRYHGQGSGLGYVLDNVQSPFLTLTPGRTYRFDQSDSSNSNHPLRFYLDANKSTSYTTDITTNGTAGSSGAYTEIEVTDSTPTILHYQCSNHGLMGNSVQVSSNNAIKLNSQAASYYLDYNNFSNTPTIPTNNNQLTNGAGYITTSFTNTNQLINGAGFITTSFTNTNQLTNGAGFITASDNITGTSAGLTGNPSITVTNITANGNVSIAGTLTYEDVTNVDSVGLITARSGIKVGSGITLSPDGDVFATGITSSTKVHIGVDTGVYNEDLVVTGNARVTGILTIGTGSIVLDPDAKQLRGLEEIVIGIANTITIKQDDKGEIEFTDAVGTPKSVGIGTTVSINTSGIVTATTFSGSGASLTNLNASNLSSGTIPDARFPSTLPAIDGSALTGIAGTANVRTGILDVAGISTFRDDVIFTGANHNIVFDKSDDRLELADGAEISFGDSEDFKIHYEFDRTLARQHGNGPFVFDLFNKFNFIHITGGQLAEDIAKFIPNGPIELYHDNTKRFSTSGIGATVFGQLDTTSDVKVGSGITLSSDGDIFATGVTTSTTFVGDLTGDVTGTASNATLAVSAQGLTGSPSVTVTNVNAVDAIISGNLSVAGTITSLDQNDILATGIITASSGVDLGDPGIVTLSSDTLTTTSTSQDTISSVSATVNRSATFQVQVTRGSEYHVTTINVVHNGTTAFLSEFGTIRTGSILATFDADISGGNLRLRATPTTSASTVFKLSKTVIKV